MIRVVDYGLGNVQAFLNIFKRLGIEAARARDASELQTAEQIILPGVGAFDHAMQLLEKSGMRDTLDELVLRRGVPVLGVCVGMQIMAGASDEGQLSGLGWIPGRVRAFAGNPLSASLPLPHMGWNDVRFRDGGDLFGKMASDPRFYFLHSYYFDCEDQENIAGVAGYGFDFACAVSFRNIHGVQCHPEKSHHFGEQLLKKFSEL